MPDLAGPRVGCPRRSRLTRPLRLSPVPVPQGGAVIYAARFPERWKPGKFDIAFHSHQARWDCL